MISRRFGLLEITSRHRAPPKDQRSRRSQSMSRMNSVGVFPVFPYPVNCVQYIGDEQWFRCSGTQCGLIHVFRRVGGVCNPYAALAPQ